MTWERFALILAVGCNIVQMMTWYDTAKKKQYAAESEFQHLKSNLLRLSQGQERIEKVIDSHEESSYRRIKETETSLIREMSEMRAIVNALIVRISGESISAILRKGE